MRHFFPKLHTDHQRILKGAFRVAFFLMLGKVAGALKETAVAYRYGVSEMVDAYQFTLTLANWLPVTALSVLGAVLIPALVRLESASIEKRRRFITELHGVTLLLALFFAISLWIAWPFVLKTLGKGLTLPVQQLSQQIIHALAPVAGLTLIVGVSGLRLRAKERHVNTLLDSLPALTIFIWILCVSSNDSAAPLAWGTCVGYVIQMICLFWLTKRMANGVWGWPSFKMESDQWSLLLRAAGIMWIGQVAMGFVNPLDQYAASHLGANANATLGYANRILSLILSVGAASIGRAALPVLAEVQSRGDGLRARVVALKWSAWMMVAGAAAALIGWIWAPHIVALIFERGAFTAQNTLVVSHILRWGLLQLPFYFGVLILVQLLASQNRYRIMAFIAVANFILKVAINHSLAQAMGAAGILLATSLMYALSYICYVSVVCYEGKKLSDKSVSN